MDNNIRMNPHQVQGGYQPDDIKTLCKRYMNYHVIGQLRDGSQVDGIIEDSDEESVTMLVPEEVDGEQVNRQQFGYGYDDDYDDDYDDYGRPRRRRYRRFRRRRYPYFYFAAPFFIPYPYDYPYYPGYGYGGY